MSKYLKEFSVTAKLVNFRVTVLGEVKMPSTYYFYETKVTALQVISLAGDFGEYANRKQVRIVRDYAKKSESFVLDFSNTASIMSSQQFLLRTGDVIYVEPLKSKNFNINSRVISVVLSALTAALTLYRIIQTN